MRIIKTFFLSWLVISNIFAAEVKIVGTIDYLLKPAQENQLKSTAAKPIKFLKAQISVQARLVLQQKLKQVTQPKKGKTANYLPAKRELGMNGVPVLDQGSFGSCVTFANTAAIDAALGLGDYVSQLCLLQLTNYYPEHAYGGSSWDGAMGRSILSRIDQHGIVSKDKQRSVGCGGYMEYPARGESTPETSISFEEYHELSEGLAELGIYWTPILDVYNALLQQQDTDSLIQDVKEAINRSHRVTMGVFFPAVDQGLAGAVGTYHQTNDTWVLSRLIERELWQVPFFILPGHEMIITGYDDEAIAVDNEGREHKGLLTLRNSWGKRYGNEGDFYMSYDYFKVLAMEAQEIRSGDQ